MMQSNAFGILTLTSTLAITLTSATWTYEGTAVTLAVINYTYSHPKRDGVLVEVAQMGKYAPGQVFGASGRVVGSGIMAGNLDELEDKPCVFPWSPPSPAPAGPWVALMGRGTCTDAEKVGIAASNNASGVILYTDDQHAHLRKISMEHPGLAVVWLGEEEGRSLARVVEGGAEVNITLTPGRHLRYHAPSVSRNSLGQRFVAFNPLCELRMYPIDCVIVTSVLFVSVSFIILMAISLAWLVFYYVQRFRYIHAKDRLARHLCNAAKKALAKIPVKNLKATDREITLDGECCAVCIEHYQVGEAIRTLPCKHQFHRCCVDPWLLEHRTCPMCKMDILKHYGYVFTGSTETVVPPSEDEGMEFEIRILSESEESVLQLDMGEGGEGGHTGMDTTSPRPLGLHTPRTAPHLTPVVMVSRSDGAGAGGGWQDRVGMESPLPDIPISPTHGIVSPPSSLLSLLSSSSKSFSPSLASSATLGKSAPSPPVLHQEGGTQKEFHPHHTTTTSEEEPIDLEVSSVFSGQCSATTSRAPTPDAAQAQEEASPTPPTQPSAPKRTKRRSVAEMTALSDTPPVTLHPASHVVSVSHF